MENHIFIYEKEMPYHKDPTLIFGKLSKNKKNVLLLESAEISNKNSLKSLMLINNALKITCNENTVNIQALSNNGNFLLKNLAINFKTTSFFKEIKNNSIVLVFPKLSSKANEDDKLKETTVFDAIRKILFTYQSQENPILLAGLFSYDLVMQHIPMDNINLKDDEIHCPDFVFYLAEQLLIFDHQSKKAFLKTFCFHKEEKNYLLEQRNLIEENLKNIDNEDVFNSKKSKITSEDISVNISDEDFCKIIEKLKYNILKGDVFQIVPSRRFSLPCPNTLGSYHQLKVTNPSPYMFYMKDDEFVLFGASPESALKYNNQTRILEIYPIAGSRPRGFDKDGNINEELDSRMELDLRLDEKELAEHLMLVDLARNDVARVCDTNTRKVEKLMQIDRYSHIMHLVSKVTGKLHPCLDALHAYQACMNMGTLTGAPKIKAMQLIYEVEGTKRHAYGGAIGYLSSNGDLDTCIVIRSAFVQNDIAYVQAGCGEVLDSDPLMETLETKQKAQAVLNAIIHTNKIMD